MNSRFLIVFLIFLLSGCSFFGEEKTETILLLYTNDEHGHIYENDGWYKGVALYEMWEEEAENCKNCSIVKISGGDSYTGTAVSTFFRGASMAETMGLLGYKVSALGNHDFDFGKTALADNSRLAKMPYISSNLVSKDMKTVLEPYFVHYAGNTKMLFVATITEETKRITTAEVFMESLLTNPAAPVSRAIAKEKAPVNIVIAHESYKDAEKWVENLRQKPLVVFTGHDHKEAVEQIKGVFFVQNAGYLKSYAKVMIEKKGENSKVVKAEIVPLKREISLKSKGSLEVKKTLDKYLVQLEKTAGAKLIFADKPLDTPVLQKLFVCSMLESFPDYDAALSNPGGFRDSIKAGDVKKSDILSIFPFDNFIVAATIKGDDLIYNISLSENAYCLKNIEKIDAEKTYRVVTTDFIYKGGDGYRFTDSQGVTTTVSWRAPLEKFLLESSRSGKNLTGAYEELLKSDKK